MLCDSPGKGKYLVKNKGIKIIPWVVLVKEGIFYKLSFFNNVGCLPE